MKPLASLFVLYSCLFVGTLATPAPTPTPSPRYKLQARTNRYAVPAMNGMLDVVDGVVGFNRTDRTVYIGFDLYITPQPRGNLMKVEPYHDLPGYLIPTVNTPNLYDFRFGPTPKIAGVLTDKFTIKVLECGAMCGGRVVVYDPYSVDMSAHPPKGRWVTFPDGKREYGWVVRWWNGDPLTPPEGHYLVNLWV